MPKSTEGFTVRVMRTDEVDLIRTWATAEGWNPGVHDGPVFHAVAPDGFFVGELDGQIIACISCVAYDDAFGFLGQYIVAPAFRGKGYGYRVWQAGLAHLSNRNVGLDGVLAQQANYARSGFVFAHQHIRYQGVGRQGAKVQGLIELANVPFEDVFSYDCQCFPASRPRFLRSWLTLPDSFALGLIREGRLSGYGVIRKSVDGFKVGPLFADDLTAAETVLNGLISEIGNTPFCLDIPETNPAAGELVQRFNMTEGFRTARMYTRGQPEVDYARIFGITSMELG